MSPRRQAAERLELHIPAAFAPRLFSVLRCRLDSFRRRAGAARPRLFRHKRDAEPGGGPGSFGAAQLALHRRRPVARGLAEAVELLIISVGSRAIFRGCDQAHGPRDPALAACNGGGACVDRCSQPLAPSYDSVSVNVAFPPPETSRLGLGKVRKGASRDGGRDDAGGLCGRTEPVRCRDREQPFPVSEPTLGPHDYARLRRPDHKPLNVGKRPLKGSATAIIAACAANSSRRSRRSPNVVI